MRVPGVFEKQYFANMILFYIRYPVTKLSGILDFSIFSRKPLRILKKTIIDIENSPFEQILHKKK